MSRRIQPLGSPGPYGLQRVRGAVEFDDVHSGRGHGDPTLTPFTYIAQDDSNRGNDTGHRAQGVDV